MPAAPKVFISYSHADKDRFVLGFASRLRFHGVDAWLDDWELAPGDSLVDKIFEEGIRNASAFIPVISRNSAESRWVKEELNAAFVQKVNSGSKLIPVVIDQCEVPQALKGTVWETIRDLNNYEVNVARIVDAIFGHSRKPPLGEKPDYLAETLVALPELSTSDTLVLKASCELVIDKNELLVDPRSFPEGSVLAAIPRAVMEDSLEVLDHRGYVKQHKFIGPGPYPYQITAAGLEAYCRAFTPNYSDLVNRISLELVNDKPSSNIELQQRVRAPLVIVDHVLTQLERYGHILMSKALGERHAIVDVRPTLKRAVGR